MNRSIVSLLLLMLLLPACGEDDVAPSDNDPQPTGALVKIDGCKQFFNTEGDEKNKSCLTWTYDAPSRVLELVHENAGFNCCPRSIDASILIDGQIITVSETEIGPECLCNCLYDLHMRLQNVNPDRYTVRVIEPYRHSDDEELLVPVDLRTQATGTFCVPRANYPWG